MQKYDLLVPFKKYLYENLTKNTAKTYYAAIVKLFNDIQFMDLKKVSVEWLEIEAAKRFRTRNEFSAVKNGLKWLAKFYPDLVIPDEEAFKKISSKKRNYSKKPPKVIYLHPTLRKINQLQNPKLKYAYRLAVVSGLRVAELADLEATDVKFENEKIYVNVQHGKGGHGGVVECQSDKYLYEHLQNFINDCKEEKLFYSEVYMREQADKLGFECHDLRRIYAIETRNKLKKEMPAEQANEIVQKELRHARFSTTKRYLFNRKLKFEKEKEITEVVKTEPKTEKQEKMVSVTKIDRKRYKEIAENIISDEVIITGNREQHIIERRGQDFYDRYRPHFKDIIDNPDFVFKDAKPNTALISKKFEEDNKYINIVLRVAVPTDDKSYKNSIITVIGQGEKRFERYLNSHEPVYRRQ